LLLVCVLTLRTSGNIRSRASSILPKVTNNIRRISLCYVRQSPMGIKRRMMGVRLLLPLFLFMSIMFIHGRSECSISRFSDFNFKIIGCQESQRIRSLSVSHVFPQCKSNNLKQLGRFCSVIRCRYGCRYTTQYLWFKLHAHCDKRRRKSLKLSARGYGSHVDKSTVRWE
jgi:hypothetical protein